MSLCSNLGRVFTLTASKPHLNLAVSYRRRPRTAVHIRINRLQSIYRREPGPPAPLTHPPTHPLSPPHRGCFLLSSRRTTSLPERSFRSPTATSVPSCPPPAVRMRRRAPRWRSSARRRKRRRRLRLRRLTCRARCTTATDRSGTPSVSASSSTCAGESLM